MSDIIKIICSLIIVISLLANLSSAVSVQNVDVDTLKPGAQGRIIVDVENVFSKDVKDVTITIKLEGLPFTTIGSSQYSVDEIRRNKDENFAFGIKAANNIELGDYQIPYILSYTLDNDDFEKIGSIGVRVTSDAEIVFSVDTETPVIGKQGEIKIKIVNKGFGNIKFTNVKIFPNGFDLLSEKEIYIGNVDSDDFETASFDVIFTKLNSKVNALIEYTNFENELIRKNLDINMKIYTIEEAEELGIIQKSNVKIYVVGLIFIFLILIIYRKIRKRRRLKRSKGD
jgi:hypothetical protein